MGKAKDTAEVLFQTALIEQGYDLPNPAHLVKRIYGLMSTELGVDPEEPLKEIILPDDEEEEEESKEDDDEDEEEEEKKEEKEEEEPEEKKEEEPEEKEEEEE